MGDLTAKKLTTVHLMRHGEVDNPQGILYGRLPGYHLSSRGQQMAQMTANYLQAEDPQLRVIIASPLERAQESAQPAAKLFGLPVGVDDNLLETRNVFEGLPVNRDRSVFLQPKYFGAYLRPWEPSWGEPYQEIVARMVQAIRVALVQAQVANGNALLVSHQLPIWVVRRFIEGKSLAHNPRKRECSLASLTSLHFAGNTLVGWDYAEPAAVLVAEASDVTPGSSAAAVN